MLSPGVAFVGDNRDGHAEGLAEEMKLLADARGVGCQKELDALR